MELIVSPETLKLAEEVAEITGQSIDEVIRRSLEERKRMLTPASKSKPVDRDRLMRFLQEEVWPKVRPEYLGRRLTKEELDELAGYAP